MCVFLTIRDIIRKVERSENLKSKALMLSGLVEWQFEDRSGTMVPFDIYTNLTLEEALEKKQQSVKIKINNQSFNAQVLFRKAVSATGRREVELLRKEMKGECSQVDHRYQDNHACQVSSNFCCFHPDFLKRCFEMYIK